jgi:peptidoglycan/LPS O-acetylase OafA/YrhL
MERSPATERRRRYRGDIEGLRAVAIVAVVLYHAHLGIVPGGFTGVDDFYVISGFLITGQLWRQIETDGRVRFARFYGKRIQRLLPVSFVVLVVTAVASAHYLPPLQAHAALKDGQSAALYVSNYRFAAVQTNYLTATAAASPFQQYWSLSLEEQFYLVWPLLLAGLALVWRSRSARRPSAASAAAVLAVVAIGSFLLSLWLTHVSQPWAFFSLPTRAWELAAGGLVAFGTPLIRKLPDRIAGALGWSGLAAVVGAIVLLPSSVPYPGFAALAPVLGSAAVIASGTARASRGPVLVLSRVGARVIGRVSYSWYLWHWPILILAPYAVGHPLSLAANLGLAVASFLVAVVSFVVIENPLRLWGWLRAAPRRVLSLGGALTVAAISVCLACIGSLPALAGQGRAPVARLTAAPPAVQTRARTPSPPADPKAPNPYIRELAAATDQVQAAVARSVPVNTVPANLTPTIPDAAGDEPPVFVDGCMDSYLDSNLEPCQFGDQAASSSVVLFGDSHAGMWFPAVDDAANQLGLRLYTWTKATCPPLQLPIFSPVLGRNFVECDQWRQNVLGQIAQVHPSLVILGVARHYTDIYGFTPYSPQWLQGLDAMVTDIRRLGPQVLVIGPVPKPPFVVPDCLSIHLTSATACTTPLSVGINDPGMASEEATVTRAGGLYLDVQPWFCTSTTCAGMVDNLLVYRDDNHITATYAAYLGPAVTDELALALGIRPAVAPPAVPATAKGT